MYKKWKQAIESQGEFGSNRGIQKGKKLSRGEEW